jgi:hypothetical protein
MADGKAKLMIVDDSLLFWEIVANGFQADDRIQYKSSALREILRHLDRRSSSGSRSQDHTAQRPQIG